jgi:hypothetical protein
MTDDILSFSSDRQGLLSSHVREEDLEPEIVSLRPKLLTDYVGQGDVVETLKVEEKSQLPLCWALRRLKEGMFPLPRSGGCLRSRTYSDRRRESFLPFWFILRGEGIWAAKPAQIPSY